MTGDLRRKWFAQLASLTYPASPGQAAEAFKVYMPMLAGIPDGAFTTRSLEAVATSPRKMAIPSYDEVAKPLGAWWRENRPFQTALPAPVIPDRVPPTEEEHAVVAALTREAVGILAQATADRPAARRDIRPHYTPDEALLTECEKAAEKYPRRGTRDTRGRAPQAGHDAARRPAEEAGRSAGMTPAERALPLAVATGLATVTHMVGVLEAGAAKSERDAIEALRATDGFAAVLRTAADAVRVEAKRHEVEGWK